uniref:Uncharacterized protein n=1 Tax=Timema cristinae TaxID=61476 RepID=A0A7R9CFQ6_TIMCR|nr:unnamed protein product [Timema cristinae]
MLSSTAEDGEIEVRISGGMKAVVWSDCFQVVMLFLSMFAVLLKGTADIGGFGVVWSRNSDAGRIQLFNWNMDPTERYTVWSTVIGAAFLHTAVSGANQLQVQRYLTVSTVRQAINMLWINLVGWTVIVMLTVYAGLLIFAQYYDCDPLKNNNCISRRETRGVSALLLKELAAEDIEETRRCLKMTPENVNALLAIVSPKGACSRGH